MLTTWLSRSGFGLVRSGFIPLLLVGGLLMAPVSCMCGASVPHGHSLFQLPQHNHASDGHDDHAESPDSPDHRAHSSATFEHQPHPLMSADPECDRPGDVLTFTGNFALSNAMEHQDGAVLQAPPSSSFGQPMVIAQPSSIITPSAQHCALLDLPGARTLEGLATSPETPPPQA